MVIFPKIRKNVARKQSPTIHYGKKGVKLGINYNFSEKIIMIFVAKTVLYEGFIGKI